MIHSGFKKLGIITAAGMVALALTSTPARANHGDDLLLPLAAFVAIGALAHQHHSHYHYQYRSYGHYRPHYYPPVRHSHSHGGYQAPRYKHHRNW